MRLPRAWFLPETHDVLSTLTAQLDMVQTVIGVLRACVPGPGRRTQLASCALCWPRNTKRGAVAHPGSVQFQYPPRREDLFELTERLLKLPDAKNICWPNKKMVPETGEPAARRLL